VEVECRAGCRPRGIESLVRAARQVLLELGRRGQVSLLFTGEAEIRALNRKFRGLDRATDVLSFPWESAGSGEGYLGDIAISLPTARRYARQAGWPLRDELRFLVLHGVLHLLGHDHETDSGAMNLLQADLARKILGREIPPLRTAGKTARSAPRRKVRRIARGRR
jgi:probable rRNA maturation factor